MLSSVAVLVFMMYLIVTVVVVLGMEAMRLSPFVGCYGISFIIQYFMERLLDPKLLISRHG